MMRILEIIAVALNILYTWLYLHGNESCFLFGALGSAIFVFLCYRKKIYAETFLQVFYIAAAVYGYMHFSDSWKTVHWSFSDQLPWIILAVVISVLAGYILKKKTDAKLPWIDSTVTVFSILATWMMVNYVHENWLYFIVINSVGIYIYLNRQLYFGAALFVLYLLMSVDGYFQLGIV